jgi:monoamine oxidase
METMKPVVRSRSARTPLFKSLRRLVGLASLANDKSGPPADELVEMPVISRYSRRDFIRTAAIGAAAISSGSFFTGCAAPKTGPGAPRIAIVGGGIAGLNAAWKLRKQGWSSQVYEASKRTGGRMFSAKDIMGPGLVTEVGAEFVDSNHKEMFDLVKEFGLEWLDVQAMGEEKLISETFFFGGSHHSELQAVEAFRPLAAKIKADYDKLPEETTFEKPEGSDELDRLSLAQYFDRIGAQGWIRQLLDVAFLTEFGLECSEQSALNMIFMISTDLTPGKMALFGESDERYKVVGGNQRVVDELARRVEDQIRIEHRLTALKQKDTGYTLTFEMPGGRTVDVNADFVILCLPFTLLREVDIQVPLPEWKKKAIAELGYGMNAKLMMGFKQRYWREKGYSGNTFSDEPFQLAWDNSRLQAGTAGGMTCYTGGKASDELKNGSPADQAKRMLVSLEKAYSGLSAQFSGKAERFHWPTHPFTKASYACYRPGQWTTVAGAEIKPVGNLFFAGEHCSLDFQGYMNGGAETGKQAAMAVRKALRDWRAAKV